MIYQDYEKVGDTHASPNNTIFETRQECFEDLLNHLPSFLENCTKTVLLRWAIRDWTTYFTHFKIKNEDELEEFLDALSGLDEGDEYRYYFEIHELKIVQ